MKLCSNVCNRCRLVWVKFYLNRISFAVVIAQCLGGSLFGTHCGINTHRVHTYNICCLYLLALECLHKTIQDGGLAEVCTL